MYIPNKPDRIFQSKDWSVSSHQFGVKLICQKNYIKPSATWEFSYSNALAVFFLFTANNKFQSLTETRFLVSVIVVILVFIYFFCLVYYFILNHLLIFLLRLKKWWKYSTKWRQWYVKACWQENHWKDLEDVQKWYFNIYFHLTNVIVSH